MSGIFGMPPAAEAAFGLAWIRHGHGMGPAAGLVGYARKTPTKR